MQESTSIHLFQLLLVCNEWLQFWLLKHFVFLYVLVFVFLNNNDRSWARLHTSWRTINLQPGVGCAKWSNIFRWHIQTKSSWPSTARKCKSLLPAHLTPFGTTRKAKLHNTAAPRDDKLREFAAFIIFLSFIVYIYTSIVLFRHITHNRNDWKTPT